MLLTNIVLHLGRSKFASLHEDITNTVIDAAHEMVLALCPQLFLGISSGNPNDSDAARNCFRNNDIMPFVEIAMSRVKGQSNLLNIVFI